MKRKTKEQRRADAEFLDAADAWIMGLQAARPVRSEVRAGGALLGPSRSYFLDTTCGMMGLSNFGDWVACDFANGGATEAAVLRLGRWRVNPCSGKYNLHGLDDLAADVRLSVLQLHLRPVLGAAVRSEAVCEGQD